MATPTVQQYDCKFFESLAQGSRDSAEIVLSQLFKLFMPTSIVDVGCGEGEWLRVCQDMGVDDLLGIDGPWVDTKRFLVRDGFAACNLADEKPSLNRTFDLAMSLEVAEHLPETSAGNFVEILTTLSDVVLFSAAVPGQGGTDHLNEQWISYWIEHFKNVGFVGVDAIRPMLWDDTRVKVWYRQNIVVFVREAVLPRYDALRRCYDAQPGDSPLSIVHPHLFENKCRALNNALNSQPSFLATLKAIPLLFVQALKRRLPKAGNQTI